MFIATSHSIFIDGTHGLRYQLQLRRQYLLRLCASWCSTLVSIDEDPEESWGPTKAELLDARVAAYQASVNQMDEGDGSEDDLELDEDNWNDAGLVEALETLELADGFRDNVYQKYRLIQYILKTDVY